MSDLTILFPGVGYHLDKPLLYYARKAALEQGYEVIGMPFHDLPTGVKGNPEKMRQAFEIAYAQAEEQLSRVDFAGYDRVVFIGKSVGTVVAAAYAKQHKVPAMQIVYTPVMETVSFLRDAKAVIFHGTDDPWCPNDPLREACSAAGYVMHEYEGANHSIETGVVETDLNYLADVMNRTGEILGRTGHRGSIG